MSSCILPHLLQEASYLKTTLYFYMEINAVNNSSGTNWNTFKDIPSVLNHKSCYLLTLSLSKLLSYGACAFFKFISFNLVVSGKKKLSFEGFFIFCTFKLYFLCIFAEPTTIFFMQTWSTVQSRDAQATTEEIVWI